MRYVHASHSIEETIKHGIWNGEAHLESSAGYHRCVRTGRGGKVILAPVMVLFAKVPEPQVATEPEVDALVEGLQRLEVLNEEGCNLVTVCCLSSVSSLGGQDDSKLDDDEGDEVENGEEAEEEKETEGMMNEDPNSSAVLPPELRDCYKCERPLRPAAAIKCRGCVAWLHRQCLSDDGVCPICAMVEDIG